MDCVVVTLYGCMDASEGVEGVKVTMGSLTL